MEAFPNAQCLCLCNAAWACYLSGKSTEKWSGRKLGRELIPFANFIFRFREFNNNCSGSWKGKLHWWMCRLLGWRAQATSRLPPPLAIVHCIMRIDSNKGIQLSLAMRQSKTSGWHFRDFIRHFNLSIFSLCLGNSYNENTNIGKLRRNCHKTQFSGTIYFVQGNKDRQSGIEPWWCSSYSDYYKNEGEIRIRKIRAWMSFDLLFAYSKQ